jgi:hypothetical protein
LKDGGHIAGATTASLRLTGVQTNDAGGYQVVVASTLGAVASATANLSVVPGVEPNPAAPLILSICLTNHVVVITWSASPNGTYLLQHKDSLQSTNWSDLPPPVVATGETVTATNTTSGVSPRFYRVVRSL